MLLQCRRLVLARPFQESHHLAEWPRDIPFQHLDATRIPVQPHNKHNGYCGSCSLEDVPAEQVSVISWENVRSVDSMILYILFKVSEWWTKKIFGRVCRCGFKYNLVTKLGQLDTHLL